MGKTTGISWTDATWNIATGCTKVSPGCKNCYMMREGERWRLDVNGTVTRTKPGTFNAPIRWRNDQHGPRTIFTCSWTDFFHPEIDSYRNEAWDIISRCPNMDFQILTKRPERIAECLPVGWGNGWKNVWLGVSAENQATADERLVILETIPARIRWLSLEPLLEGVDLAEFGFLDWIVIGGESGPASGKWKARPCRLEWIEFAVLTAALNETPVFVKQLGNVLAKSLGVPGKGDNIADFPNTIQSQFLPC